MKTVRVKLLLNEHDLNRIIERSKYYKIGVIMHSKLIVTMPNGEKWEIPTNIIVRNRAKTRKEDIAESKSYFDSYPDELIDWATNNMNWKDVENYATRVGNPDDVDYDEGWINGEKELIK